MGGFNLMASSSKFPGVRKKAPGKFIIDYKDHNNKRRQITYLGIETDAVRARKALLVKRDRIIAGLEAPPEAIKVPPTLQILWGEFEQDRKLEVAGGSMRQNSLDRYKWVKKALKKYSKKLLKTSVDQIKSSDLKKFKAFRLISGVTKEGVNTDLRHIRAVFNFAVKQGHIQKSPMIDVRRIKVTKKDVRFLNSAELTTLNKTLESLDLTDEFQRDAYDLTIFYLYTGPRGKEGLLPNFTWDCVEQGSICFPKTKNYQARTISIIKPVADVLESRKKLPDGPFNFTYNQLYKRIKYVIKAAGIENAGPHTLRKTAGAFYYMATRDIYATKEWMGHSDISITIKHYSGLMQSMKREYDLAFENLLTAQLMGQL